MEWEIKINFIYSNDAVKIKSFLNKIPRSIDYVNYIDIINKLTNNDYYQHEPSTEVVSSYLIKELNNIFKKDSTRSIYYVLGNLNEETVNNIKRIILNLTDKNVRFIIYYDTAYSFDDSSSLFDEVIEF
jgi:hypothetical protein